MITTLNGVNAEIQARYLKLFNEASEALIEAGQLEPTYAPAPSFDPDSFVNGTYYEKVGDKYLPVDTYEDSEGKELYIKTSSIATLEEYFCNIRNLYDLQLNNKFLMLPLNEDFFEINANTRTITVPSAFKKGVGVQGDILAETLLFRIDRFFDVMDLYTTDIYVQWEGPDKQQYVSPITMIDAEAYADEGKLVFAWPLTENPSATAGTIKFAIRFIKEDPAISNKIVYSFGTLAAQAVVNSSLAFDIFADSVKVDDGAADLFSDAIENSENTVGPQAKAPVFINNLPAVLYMVPDDNGELVTELRVSTSVADLGNVTYKWYHKANADARRVFLAQDNSNVNDNEVAVKGKPNFKVITKFILTQDAEKQNNKVYYTKSADGLAYVRNSDANADVTTLYERYSVLQISGTSADTLADGSSPVTGYYYVEATNRTGLREKTSKSDSTNLPMPNIPEIKTNLKATAVIEDDPSLEVTINPDANATNEFVWYTSTTDDEEKVWEVVENDSANILLANKAGWYKVDVKAMANLGCTYKESDICKVTNLPVAPEFDAVWTEGADEQIVTFDTATGEAVVTLTMADIPTGALYTDKLTYTWYVDDTRDDAEEDAGFKAYAISETPTYVFTKGTLPYGGLVQCHVLNELNGKKSAENKSCIIRIQTK